MLGVFHNDFGNVILCNIFVKQHGINNKQGFIVGILFVGGF